MPAESFAWELIFFWLFELTTVLNPIKLVCDPNQPDGLLG